MTSRSAPQFFASLLTLLSRGGRIRTARFPVPKPESSWVVYQRKRSFSLVEANIRSHTGTVWFGRVPLVLLPRCYLGEDDQRFRFTKGRLSSDQHQSKS
jgi:hypothetical protein